MGILDAFRKPREETPVPLDPNGEDVYEVRTTEVSPNNWTYKIACNGAVIESSWRSFSMEWRALEHAKARVKELKFKPTTNRHIL